ncbi:MAG TPA: YtxH domain-containing protein [Armatimonadota bacterium]|nr:YtxH domain-containing protein [Armatimonadota bacterium]
MAQSRDFLIGVIVGSAIGAAAALLYAPQAGVDTRSQLRDKAAEAKERTAELAQQAGTRVGEVTGQAKARVGELAQQAQTKAGEVTSQAKARVGEISQQAQSAVERGRQAVEQQRDAVRTAVEAGRQAYTEKQTELKQEVAADTLPAAALLSTTESFSPEPPGPGGTIGSTLPRDETSSNGDTTTSAAI